MPNSDAKLTDLPLATSLPSGSIVYFVDPADPTEDATGTSYRITQTNFSAGLSGLTRSQITDLAGWTGGTSIASLGTITTGVWHGTAIATGYGGTGLDTSSAANGKLLIGNSAGLTLANLTQGSGITITNGAGSITIASTGGSPAGSTGNLQYDNAGSFGGATNLNVGSSGELVYGSISDPGSPAAGSLWQSSTTKGLSTVGAGVIGRVPAGLIWSQVAAGTAVANTVTQTTLLAGGTSSGTLTVPANALTAGKRVYYSFAGTYGTTGTPTIVLAMIINGHSAHAGAITLTAVTGKTWILEGWIQLQTIGASGKYLAGGFQMFASGAASTTVLMAPICNSTAGNAFAQGSDDTTVSNALDLMVTWGTANASNTIAVSSGSIFIEG